jgi:murein L,D-transpeptidase YafK
MRKAFWLSLVALAFLGTMHLTGENERLAEVKRRIGPGLRESVAEKEFRWGAPVFIRIFKEEKVLELWLDDGERYRKFRTYPVAAMSGQLGPKLAEGDGQAPEGFYAVGEGSLLPTSRYHLAFNIGFPNAYDRALGRTGSFIMVHGARASIGCFAMTDAKIEEIYLLCEAALEEGQPFFRVHLFPFRMTNERMAEADGHRWEEFWKELRSGYQYFEENRVPPQVDDGAMARGEYRLGDDE